VLAAAVTTAAGLVPCAVLTLQPACQLAVTGGPVLDTAELVRVDIRTDVPGVSEAPGRSTRTAPAGLLLATTIEVSEPDGWADWLAAHRDPSTTMIARSLLVPAGEGLDAVAEAGRRSMGEAQQRAAGLALQAVGRIAGPEVPPDGWPVQVSFATDGVGGPSAGLMIALSVAAQAGQVDVSAGLRVAGTGALSPDGTVLGVGGVDHKLRSVVARGDAATLDAFLLPPADLALARRTRLEADVLLVPVRDLEAALAALVELRAGRTPAGAVLLSAAPEGSR
jgi:PDZ domain-containing secreted protein